MSAPLRRAGRELRRLVRARRPLLLLDLDGTLAPIVDQPQKARVRPSTLAILQRLRATGATVILVSGRSVNGVRLVARTPVDAILGDHGARYSRGNRTGDWLPADRARFLRAMSRVVPQLSRIAGVMVQQKERSIAVHLQLPRPDRTARRISRLLRAQGLRVLRGHRVLDGQLPGVNKGAAVLLWLVRHPQHDAVLYAGDDTTDQDAFRTLRGRGMTIAVGPRPRGAAWRTRDPATFAAWLARLAAARAADGGPKRQ